MYLSKLQLINLLKLTIQPYNGKHQVIELKNSKSIRTYYILEDEIISGTRY